MKKSSDNNSIGCTVDTCKYHCGEDNCCSLNCIAVGTCNCKPETSDGTCCQSFQVKSGFFGS